MSSIKAVIFGGGVLVPWLEADIITTYEKELGLPGNYLKELFSTEEVQKYFCKLKQGKLTTSQIIPVLEREFRENAQEKWQNIPFSTKDMLDRMSLQRDKINKDVITAARQLKKSGILVGVICNNWIDDRESAKQTHAEYLTCLRLHFDVVVESSQIGSEMQESVIYETALENLKAAPQESIFLDVSNANCNRAKEIGMAVINVATTAQALRDLSKSVGASIQENLNKKIFPSPVGHNQVSHCYAEVQPGVVLHYVDVGVGPVVMMIHGFPELWYSWRYQISALADEGYRVIAMDTRGYGESSCPHEISAYSQEEVCKDVIGLMNRLSIPLCTIIGHDWGGFTAWNLALKYPGRVRAICSVNTPYLCHEGLQNLKDNISVFNYQIYFQQTGVPEKEFEENLPKVFHVMYTNYKSSKIAKQPADKTKQVGFMGGIPDDIKSNLISDEEVEYFVKNYKKTGFRGPLNYYRNGDIKKFMKGSSLDRKITCPALMVTTGNDLVLRPEFSEGMEKEIPNLSRAHIDDCGHWSMFEKPDQLSACIVEWLQKLQE